MSANTELPASVAASGIPAAYVPREIQQAVAAIRAAGGRSVSLEPVALQLGLKRTTFLRRADLRLPLDPEYMGEGFAVLAKLREQLAKIEAAAAVAEHREWRSRGGCGSGGGFVGVRCTRLRRGYREHGSGRRRRGLWGIRWTT